MNAEINAYLFRGLFFGAIFIIATMALISDDISSQCLKIANNTTIQYNKCYLSNAPFPLNVDTSNWHIWKVKQ